MSVTIRPYRERRLGSGHSHPASGRFGYSRTEESTRVEKSAAQRWAEARERYLLQHGKPRPIKKRRCQRKQL